MRRRATPAKPRVNPAARRPLDTIEHSIFAAALVASEGWPRGVALVSATNALILLARECALPGHERDAIETCAALLKHRAEAFPRGTVQ